MLCCDEAHVHLRSTLNGFLYKGCFLEKNSIGNWLGPAFLYKGFGNCILENFSVWVAETPLKIESHFVAREVALRKTLRF